MRMAANSGTQYSFTYFLCPVPLGINSGTGIMPPNYYCFTMI